MPITENSLSGVYATYSTANSLYTPLPANTTFTGQWEDVSGYATISVLCRTDVPGSLYYDHSMDGVEVDRTFRTDIAGSTEATFLAAGPRSKFLRFRFINGSQPQGVMRMQVAMSPSVVESGIASVSSGISVKTNSIVTRTALFGRAPDGSYLPVPVDQTGAVNVTLATAVGAVAPVFRTASLDLSDTAQHKVTSYTPAKAFSLQAVSVFAVQYSITASIVKFGTFEVRSPAATPIYSGVLTSLNGGTHSFSFPGGASIPAGQEVSVCCYGGGVSQTWTANLFGTEQQ